MNSRSLYFFINSLKIVNKIAKKIIAKKIVLIKKRKSSKQRVLLTIKKYPIKKRPVSAKISKLIFLAITISPLNYHAPLKAASIITYTIYE